MNLKSIFVLLLLFILKMSFRSMAVEGWASVSSLWGQGGAGISYSTNKTDYCLSDFFSYDLKYKKLEYNEVEVLVQRKYSFGGLRLRDQSECLEYAPFIGRHDYFPSLVSFSLHNEIEFRDREDGVDYLRTQHGLTLFPYDITSDDIRVRFFTSVVPYVNWRETDIEKVRVYVGYSMAIEKYKVSLYYIPWRDGELEKEWDDQNDFGVSMKIAF